LPTPPAISGSLAAGGWGYASSLAQSTGFLNDVWEYDQSLNQWIFWQPDSLDYFWVFSGQGFDATTTKNGYLNDMWTYLPFPKYPNQ
jgi:hypothetical protein